jgi:hypothetical protein
MPGHKICNKCKLTKDHNEFSKRGKNSNLLQSSCKMCVAARVRKNYKDYYSVRAKELYKQNPRKADDARLKRLYGISIAQYNEMLEEQNNVCAVCLKPETSTHKNGTIKQLSVDHCHKTNKIRGLLCDACNRAEGFLRSDVDLIRKLADYVEKHNLVK